MNRLFCESEITSVQEFIDLARNPNTLFYVVIDIDTEDFVCVVWLNGRTTCNCSLHGAFFKGYLRKSVDITRQLLRSFFIEVPNLESIIGFVPKKNRLAIAFGKRVGWTKVGTIPNLITNSKTREAEAGVLFYILKDEV